jgi:hypothetical protein
MLRTEDAAVVRALADLALRHGAPTRLVDRCNRIAEKIEGKPKDDACLAARRRCGSRVGRRMSKFAIVALVALSAASGPMAVAKSLTMDLRVAMTNGEVETVEIDGDASANEVWAVAMDVARHHHAMVARLTPLPN